MILENLELLKEISDWLKNNWKKIWFTNWCFDIIHPGHIYNFQEAKKYCDILIVAINWDKSPYRKTKPWRPIHDQSHRAIILDSIKYIDYVIFFDEETPIIPISKILPDVLIKWWDYKAEDIVWYKEVINNWWKIVIIPTVDWYSTTNSVKKILSNT